MARRGVSLPSYDELYGDGKKSKKTESQSTVRRSGKNLPSYEELYGGKGTSKAVSDFKPVTAAKNLLSNPTVQRVAGAINEAGKTQTAARNQAIIDKGMPSGVDMLRDFRETQPEQVYKRTPGLIDKLGQAAENVGDFLGVNKAIKATLPSNALEKPSPMVGYRDYLADRSANPTLPEQLAGGIGNALTLSAQKRTEQAFFGNAAGRGYETPAAITGEVAGSIVGPGSRTAAKLAGKLIPGTGKAAGMGRVAADGAIANTINQVGQEAVDVGFGGKSSVGERAARVGVSAGLGAGAGVGLAVIGKGAQEIARRTGLTDKIQAFVSRNRAVPEAAEKATRAAFENVPTGRLQNASNEQYVNRVMSEIRPTVHERMTPPLENPNELAKWLQPHLDTSLNQIRKLPYEDLRELAEEVRSHMSMYEVARDVAKQRGFDLDTILNSGRPSIPGQAERLRMGAVAGAVDPPKNVKVATAPGFTPKPTQEVQLNTLGQGAETMKGNWFTNLFGNTGLGATPFGSTKRISKAPLTTEEQIVSRKIKNDKDGVIDAVAASSRAAYQNMVDYLSPLKKLGERVYGAAMDSVRANNLANTIIRDKFVTPEGQVVGEGLENIFKKVARGQDKSFVDFLVLRHAKTRMARGERVYDESLNMTPEKVQQRIDLLNKRHPGFDAIAKEWDQFNDNMLKTYGLKEGLISQDLYEALRKKNPNYAPMYRQFSRSEKPGRSVIMKSTGSSFSGQKAPIKEVSPTGSTRRIVDPRKSTIEAAAAWTNAAMRNRSLQIVAQQAAKDPNTFKGLVEVVQKPKDMRDLRDILLKDGEDDFLEAMNSDITNLFKRTRADKDNIVRVMMDGEPVYLQVHDPEIMNAIMGMGPQASSILVDVLGAFSNGTKRGATGLLAPMFAVKGATMDLVQSAIQAKNPARQATDTVYALFSGIGDKLNIPGLRNWAQEYRRAGGQYSAALKGDRKVDRRIYNMTRYPILSPQNIGKVVFNTAKAPFKALEAVGDIAENAPRIAAARGEMRRLGGSRTPDNVRLAMDAGRESTVNFSRKGAWSRDLESVIPYNNAAIQGIYRVGRAIKQNPVRTVAAVGTLAVLPKMYEYAQFADDPDYQQIPARERYRNLIVNKNPDGSFVKIPMEPAYNSIGELTIEALRMFKDGDGDAFKGFADAMANVWTPPLVTGAMQGVTQDDGLLGSIEGSLNATVAAPFSAVISNKSFTGAPIVPKRLEGRSTELQYDERTTAPAKWLADKLNMAPMHIDYLIRAYGGDAARLVAPLTSEIGAGTPRNTLLKNFITDPALTNTLTNDFYKAQEKVNQAKTDFDQVGKEPPSWYNDELRKLVTSTAKGTPLKLVKDLSDEKRAVNADKTLSASRRSERIRTIQRQINEIYIDLNAKLDASGVPMLKY